MRPRLMWTLVLAVAVVTAACGDSKSSLLPTAPSALSADAPSAATAAGEYETTANGPKPDRGNGNENGNGNGNGNGSGNPRTPGNTSPAPVKPVPPGKAKVEFEGFVQAVGGDSLTVNGQKVMVTAETVIRHGNRRFELPEVNPNDRVHVRANRVVAADVTLEATDIMVQKPGEAPLPEAVVVVEPDVLVSVSALDASAFEAGVAGGDPAAFQLTRTGTPTQLAASLSVSFTLDGTATAADYAPVTLTAVFPANETTVNVAVTPVADGLAEPAESVVLTLAGGTGYEVGSPAMATVTIADQAPPTVNVRAADADAEEINFNSGRLEISRTGNLQVPLTLTIEFSGTATFNVDYRLSPPPPTATFTFTMAANQAVLLFTVNPVNDALVESEETVVLSAVASPNYLVGTSGTVTIRAR